MTPRFSRILTFKSQQLWALGLIFALFSSSGVALPVLRAVGFYEELGKAQFMAGVYTEKPYAASNELIISRQDKVIEIRVVANKIFARRFRRMWIEGAAINSSVDEYKKHSQSMVQFGQMLQTSLQKNDILRLERDQVDGMDIKLNGDSLGNIESPEFFDLLTRVLVGPVPISIELKKAISAPKPSTDLIKQFSSIKPTSERKVVISDNLKEKQRTQRTVNEPKIDAVGSTQKPNLAKPSLSLNQTQPVVKPKPKPILVAIETSSPKKTVVQNPAQGKNDEVVGVDNASKKIRQEKATEAPLVNTNLVASASKVIEVNNADSIISDVERVLKRDPRSRDEPGTELIARQKYYSDIVAAVAKGIKRTKDKAPMGNTRLAKTVVRVNVTVTRDGGVRKIEISTPSSNETYNKAAEVAVQQAAPFSKFPPKISDDELEMTVPIAIDWLYTTELGRAGLL